MRSLTAGVLAAMAGYTYTVKIDAVREMEFLRDDAGRRGHRKTTPSKARQAKLKMRRKGRH